MRGRVLAGLVAVLVFAGVHGAWAQGRQGPSGPPTDLPSNRTASAPKPATMDSLPPLAESDRHLKSEMDLKLERHQRDAMAAARRKRVAEDSAKLLVLAKELQQETEAAGDGPLSAAAAKKLEQIEKLAHGVRQRMSEQD